MPTSTEMSAHHSARNWYLASSMSARPNQGVRSHSANRYSASRRVRNVVPNFATWEAVTIESRISRDVTLRKTLGRILSLGLMVSKIKIASGSDPCAMILPTLVGMCKTVPPV